MKSLIFVVLLCVYLQVSCVEAGGDVIPSDIAPRDMDGNPVSSPYLPNCELNASGHPIRTVFGLCDSGRCLKTKIKFRTKGDKICCCTNWNNPMPTSSSSTFDVVSQP
ncbi:unnamed protein product [Chironomus riparius]|uniref:Secreted protein n=1 Tax=Chironomus riparius TaxID=315576 RepID=A0A9N9RRH2_9DIPT|nr:unnamed protein product [Chironomus riparius]